MEYGDYGEEDSMESDRIEDGWGYTKYEKEGGSNACDALNVAMDEAADLVFAGKITGPELQIIWDYVDEKLLAGLQRDGIASVLQIASNGKCC